MTTSGNALDHIRDQILSDPGSILEDRALMKALIAADSRALGENVVDLRGVAMNRLEARYERLEDTHRSVIAAAYENLAGMGQVNRAVLALLEPLDFQEFLASLKNEIVGILKVDNLRLCLESNSAGHPVQEHLSKEFGGVLGIYGPGSIDEYLTDGRNMTSRVVTLRQVSQPSETLYGQYAAWVQSEALLKLDLGPTNLPGMLALGSEDPHQFGPKQGTDLLTFFAGALERVMQRWLR